MSIPISRRSFLKLSALSLATLAARPYSSILQTNIHQGRVTHRTIDIFQEPDTKSKRAGKFERDKLVEIQAEIYSPAGPDNNPIWYRVADGYIHSGYIQRVDEAHLNAPLSEVPITGISGEITVPYSQAFYTNRQGEWMPLYRLYFQSIHWITGVWEDAEGQPWYQLTDEWLKINYHIPARHVCPIPSEKFTPISPHVPVQAKRIEVNLTAQTMSAYEDNVLIYTAPVATGKRYMETPSGEFQINRKTPSKHMGNGALTSEILAYELPGVPWVCFFHTNGVAFHGTYWHNNYGIPMSRGCINLRVADAHWLFRWCTPAYSPIFQSRKGWFSKGKGTQVNIS